MSRNVNWYRLNAEKNTGQDRCWATQNIMEICKVSIGIKAEDLNIES